MNTTDDEPMIVDNTLKIHPSAVVSSNAELADGVEIGPYTTVGDHVVLGRDTAIGAHVVIEGHTPNRGTKQDLSLFFHRHTAPRISATITRARG